jgi:hypothetical protein
LRNLLVQSGTLGIAVKAFPGALGAHALRWITLGEKDGRILIMTCLEILMQPLQSRVEA